MKNPKSAWLLAAATTVVVAVLEAATLLRMIPGTTIVDVVALLIPASLRAFSRGFMLRSDAPGETLVPSLVE